MYGYIYKFTLIPTGKIYVGKRSRSSFDENYFGSGKLWKPLIKQYGKYSIKREVLEWCETEDDLLIKEKFWIKELRSRDPEIGYNLSAGGRNPILSGSANAMFGKPYAEERRKKQSETLKKQYGDGRINPSTKPENAKKISESLIGHKVSQETRDKLSNINKDKVYITNGESVKWCKKCDLNMWLDRGFSIKIPKRVDLSKLTPDELEFRKQEIHKRRSESTSGRNNGRYGDHRIWITDGTHNKQIKELSELSQFPGYIRGKTQNVEKYRWVTDGIKSILIKESNIEMFLKENTKFHLGRVRGKINVRECSE